MFGSQGVEGARRDCLKVLEPMAAEPHCYLDLSEMKKWGVNGSKLGYDTKNWWCFPFMYKFFIICIPIYGFK